MPPNSRRFLKTIALSLLCCTALIQHAAARSGTPPANRTGAPPQGPTQSCSVCHGGGPGGGSVSISLSGGTEYTPGQMYSMMVTVTDPGKVRFGFSMVARDTDNNTLDVGIWAPSGPNTQVYEDGTHVGHLSAPREPDTFTFTVNWTAPASGVGDVTFYAAGNGANGSGTGGDNIYLNTLTISELTTPALPPVLSDLIFLENGSAQLTLTGTPGQTYTVKHSANLVAWELLEMITLTGATTTVTDPDAPGNTPRFYQATQNAP